MGREGEMVEVEGLAEWCTGQWSSSRESGWGVHLGTNR